jgi:translation elongation factor EF-Ts
MHELAYGIYHKRKEQIMKRTSKMGTIKKVKRSPQLTGGTITIPEGYVVLRVDLDADVPIIEINKEGSFKDKNKKILEVPRALAYYLTTHHNGSNKVREQLRTDAQNQLRSMLRDLLEKKDYSVSPQGRNM